MNVDIKVVAYQQDRTLHFQGNRDVWTRNYDQQNGQQMTPYNLLP